METDTQAPPAPASDPPEVVAVRAAEAAQAAYQQAAQQAAQKAESAEQRASRLEAELEALKGKLGAVDALAAVHQREADSQRLAALRRMGLDERLADAHALALAPKVDPRDPSGLVELERWRQANASLFKPSRPTEAEVIGKLTPRIDKLPKSALFDPSKLLAKLYGGK